MNYNTKVRLKNDVRFLCGEKKVLICNMDNAESLFLSSECKEIIETAIKENISFNELIEAIEDKHSREYLIQVINKLDSLRMWDFGDLDLLHSENFDISLDITNDCNLRCRHCCVNAGEIGNSEDLSTEKLLKIVQSIVELNPSILTISGGEPLMRPDFCMIVDKIRLNYNGMLTLMTNATLINERLAEYIKKNFDAVDVSIDGADEKSCSLLRGRGVFEKCINGIQKLKEAGVERISASMVVTTENEYAKYNFVELCKALDINPMIRVLDKSGRAKDIYSDIKRNEKYDFNQNKIEELFYADKMYKIQPQVFACQGAKREFQIDYKGNIFPCGALMDDMFCMGNICEIENLKDYLEKRKFEYTSGYKKFKSYFPYNLEKCKDCNVNLLCFSCVNETRRFVESEKKDIFCRENKCYYNLYWRDYENI